MLRGANGGVPCRRGGAGHRIGQQTKHVLKRVLLRQRDGGESCETAKREKVRVGKR